MKLLTISMLILLVVLVQYPVYATRTRVNVAAFDQVGETFDPVFAPMTRYHATGQQLTFFAQSDEPAPFPLPYILAGYRENTTNKAITVKIDFDKTYFPEGHYWNERVQCKYFEHPYFDNCGVPLGIKDYSLGDNSQQYSFASSALLHVSIHNTYTLQPGESVGVYVWFFSNRVETTFSIVRQEHLFGAWIDRPEANGCITMYAYSLGYKPVVVRGTCTVVGKTSDGNGSNSVEENTTTVPR